MDDHELENLRVKVARLESMIETGGRSGGASVARARQLQRRVMWLGAAGLCMLPMVGWTAVQLTEFEQGTPIYADQVNTNFSNINAALDTIPIVQLCEVGVDGAEACGWVDDVEVV